MLRRSFLATALAPAVRAIQNDKLDEAHRILEDAIVWDKVRYYSLYVRQGRQRARFVGGPDINVDTPFLLASITKPMTITAVMMLVETDAVKLDDPVQRYIPQFKGAGREAVTLRHLCTHTSGLPDMLPDNEKLRAAHSPLSKFVEGACEVPLLFKPGSRCKYQSMGILLAAEVVEKVAQTPLRDFLRKRVFEPLEMETASLGLGGRKIEDTARCQVSGNDDWNWNSPYWRDLGAPWGGAHASAEDVGKLLEYFLHPTWKVLRPATARRMIENQNRGLNLPWGLGWMVEPGKFGKACSDQTFGHWGSTGTVAWCDQMSGAVCVLLTTRPADESRASMLGPVSDVVASATAVGA
jgi:CubicO group peptidase (beta-lactamase class C family)